MIPRCDNQSLDLYILGGVRGGLRSGVINNTHDRAVPAICFRLRNPRLKLPKAGPERRKPNKQTLRVAASRKVGLWAIEEAHFQHHALPPPNVDTAENEWSGLLHRVLSASVHEMI